MLCKRKSLFNYASMQPLLRCAAMWIIGLASVGLATVPAGCNRSDEQREPAPQPAPQQTVHQSSDSLRPDLAEAFQLIRSNRPDQARLRLQRIMQREPDDGQALFLFGLSFHVQHRYSQARSHFERALELEPHYPPLHYFYGWCLYYLGEHDEARAAFEQHLAMQPREADTHYALGLIALQQDRLDDAEASFVTAIDLLQGQESRAEDLGRAHGGLGRLLARRGDLAAARQHLSRAAELYPDDHESLYQLYRVLVQLGDEDAAADALRRHQQARERADLPTPPQP